MSYYLDDTGNVVTMTLNGEDVASVDLSGHFEEHKEYNESFDGIDFGSHYSFHEQDGIWYFVNAGRIYVKRDGKSVYDEDMIPYNSACFDPNIIYYLLIHFTLCNSSFLKILIYFFL